MEEQETKTREADAEGLGEEAKDLANHIVDFAQTYVQLLSIKAAEKTINLISSVVNFTAAVCLGLFAIFFLGFGAAWWLGNVVNSRAGGFFIVAGFFILCMFILIARGKQTVIPFFRNVVTRLIYD